MPFPEYESACVDSSVDFEQMHTHRGYTCMVSPQNVSSNVFLNDISILICNYNLDEDKHELFPQNVFSNVALDLILI